MSGLSMGLALSGYGGRPKIVGGFSLTASTEEGDGLYGFQQAGHATYPFVPGDWTLDGLDAVALDGSGNIIFTKNGAGGGDWEHAYESEETEFDSWFIQSLASITISDDTGRWFAVGLGGPGANQFSAIGSEFVNDSDLWLLHLGSAVDDAPNNAPPAKEEGTFYRSSYYSRPNAGTPANRDLDGYDFLWDTLLQAVNQTALGTEKPGVAIPRDLQATAGGISLRYVARNPYWNFSVPAASGYTCQVCQADDTVLATGDESGAGTVQLSAMQVNLDLAKKVRVLDGESVLAQLSPTDPTFGIAVVSPNRTYTLAAA